MASEIYNPSLQQVPRSAKAPILPSPGDVSILAWLERIGRLRSRDTGENFPDEAESEEISDLMGGDDSFEDDEDDGIDLDDED